MAIRKISRLQHRRGLKSDLPIKLNEGELGWCLDTRELYIGNSDAVAGNSQILTQWTPNDRIIQHAYVGYTGVPAAAVVRNLGAKLDDFVSVRDYGAVGNGVADDYAAIQLAITDTYDKAVANGFNQLTARVTIYIPAGTYRITQPLKLYPYVKLQGEGLYRTVITIDNILATCVAQTADSNGNISTNIGLDDAVVPARLDINDLAFVQTNPDANGISVDRANNVSLSRVRIAGPFEYDTGITSTSVGISINSYGTTPSLIPNGVLLDQVEIHGMYTALFSNDPIRNLRVVLGHIHNCANGITLGDFAVFGGPAMTKVTNTMFTNIENHAIKNSGSNLGIVSTGNSFDTVGIIGGVSAIVWPVSSTGCASIGDQFINTGMPFITNLNPANNTIVGPQKLSITVDTPDLIGPVILIDNNPLVEVDTNIAYDTAVYNTININYSISRGAIGSEDKRVGKLTILTNGTTAIVQDDFNTLGSDLGITFGYRILANILIVTYTSTGTGFDATMLFTESKWLT